MSGIQLMNRSKNFFVHDHSQYEETLSLCHEAIKREDWDEAGSLFEELVRELESHIHREEEVVFPVYKAMVKISHDPIMALHTEHERIISILKDMQQVFRNHDLQHVRESIDLLKDLIRKHHEKEEDIFLPMAGYVLKDYREQPAACSPD